MVVVLALVVVVVVAVQRYRRGKPTSKAGKSGIEMNLSFSSPASAEGPHEVRCCNCFGSAAPLVALCVSLLVELHVACCCIPPLISSSIAGGREVYYSGGVDWPKQRWLCV